MNLTPEQAATAAADPQTDLAQLAEIAHHFPSARAAVAANPSAYPALLEWLAALGDPTIDEALAQRNGPQSPLPSAESRDPVVSPAVVPPAAPAVAEIAALVLAVLLPLVGLILGLVLRGQTRARGAVPSPILRAAVIVASIALVLSAAGIITTAVLINKAVVDARNAPFCASVAQHPDLLSPDGPASLYEPMWTEQTIEPEDYFYLHVDQIEAWHQEWLDLAYTVPEEETYLYSEVQTQAELLDTSTGYRGDRDNFNEKSWWWVGGAVDVVNSWAEKNC